MKQICDKCGKEVKEGDARYCGLEFKGVYRHADCHDWRTAKDYASELKEIAARAETAINNLRQLREKMK